MRYEAIGQAKAGLTTPQKDLPLKLAMPGLARQCPRRDGIAKLNLSDRVWTGDITVTVRDRVL